MFAVRWSKVRRLYGLLGTADELLSAVNFSFQ